MRKDQCGRIAFVMERLGRLAAAESYSDGLQPVQWEVLRYLARANRFSNTAVALTSYLGLTKGTVSQTVKSLEGKKLLRKDPDKHDRRNVRLFLTPGGRRLLSRDPMNGITETLGGLPGGTRKNLMEGMEALLWACLEARQRQPFGFCRDCRYFGRHHADGGPHRCLLLDEKLSAEDSGRICYEQQPRA